MPKHKKYNNKPIFPALIIFFLLCVGSNVIAQQKTRSFILTNNACGTYPEKGNFLESASILNAGGNGCVTTITSGKNMVLFKGRDKVILGPGFHTQPGAKFIAFIETDSAMQSLINEQSLQINDVSAGAGNFSAENFSAEKFPVGKAFISQNFPNPVRNNTIISYGVPQKFSTAQIVLYDVMGRKLKQINIPVQGTGTVNFNAALLSSGIYNYSLWVDGQLTETRKMIIIK